MESTPQKEIEIFSNIKAIIRQNKQNYEQKSEKIIKDIELSDKKQGFNGQQIKRMNQEIIMKIQKSKSVGYSLSQIGSPLKEKRNFDIAKETKSKLMKEITSTESIESENQQCQSTYQSEYQNFNSDISSQDVAYKNKQQQRQNEQFERTEEITNQKCFGNISNLSKQLLENQSQKSQDQQISLNNDFPKQEKNINSVNGSINQIQNQLPQQDTPLKLENNQSQQQQQQQQLQQCQLQQRSSSQTSNLFQSQFLSQGMSNSLPFIIQPDENSEWDTDDEQEIRQKQKYFDTVEFKPRAKFQISPETDFDQINNQDSSEHYDDFDFQLEDDCQL